MGLVHPTEEYSWLEGRTHPSFGTTGRTASSLRRNETWDSLKVIGKRGCGPSVS